LGDEPISVATDLDAIEVDGQARLERHWSDIRAHLASLLDWAGLARIEAEELLMIPGLDEVFALAEVKQRHDAGDYDVLVVDCAPTAETLRLLSLPDVLTWFMSRVFPVGRQLAKAMRPVAARMTTMPLPGDEVLHAVQGMWDQLAGVREVLCDPKQTSVRLVMNPEKMVIAEARRTFTYLCLFGYAVDAVVVNRILPPEVSDPYLARWKELQRQHLAEVYEAFSPLPVFETPLFETEPVGNDALLRVADACYEDSDPTAVLSHGLPIQIVEDGDRVVVDMALPFVGKGDVDLGRRDGQLFVKIGPYRRTLILPASLERRSVVGARFDGDRLKVEFT
jgi:arsenite-transporting ATPase